MGPAGKTIVHALDAEEALRLIEGTAELRRVAPVLGPDGENILHNGIILPGPGFHLPGVLTVPPVAEVGVEGREGVPGPLRRVLLRQRLPVAAAGPEHRHLIAVGQQQGVSLIALAADLLQLRPVLDALLLGEGVQRGGLGALHRLAAAAAAAEEQLHTAAEQGDGSFLHGGSSFFARFGGRRLTAPLGPPATPPRRGQRYRDTPEYRGPWLVPLVERPSGPQGKAPGRRRAW